MDWEIILFSCTATALAMGVVLGQTSMRRKTLEPLTERLQRGDLTLRDAEGNDVAVATILDEAMQLPAKRWVYRSTIITVIAFAAGIACSLLYLILSRA